MDINTTYAMPILTLSVLLKENNIPHNVNSIWDGCQIRFPWCEGDIVCHGFSYGNNIGNVESCCFPWDEDNVTQLTVFEAAKKVINYYNEMAE